MVKPKTTGTGNGSRNWLSPLNLHWAGVGLLVLVNVYLLVQLGLVWHGASRHNAEAMEQQRIALKTAQISAAPLRGLDTKLATATTESDRFYQDRLPASDSEMLTELGVLMKKAGVRLTRVQYTHVPVLAGSAGELTEDRMDATMSGDYRPLMVMLNSLERDKMFFVINRVTLTGQQTGTVNVRLGLTTFLRPYGSSGPAVDEASAGTGTETETTATGGPGQ
jgi:type IV pilus assembly protein PilO